MDQLISAYDRLIYGLVKGVLHMKPPETKKINNFFLGPASSQHYNSGGGGSPEIFFDSFIMQLRALATLRPIWGRVGQGAFELSLPQIRK